MITVLNNECRSAMREMAESSVDSIVTDPPYGLSFMGKEWDHGVPGVEFWAEALRVAKPGAHLLAFGGTRTFHRLACAIEDAGWEIRDCVMWVYGQGFPKSRDVSKAIDKTAGVEREMRVNERWAERYPNGPGGNLSGDGRSKHYGQAKRVTGNPLLTSDPVTDAAKQWQGWGTALKPAWEPIIVARKPLAGTMAANVQQWGTGAINVDGCRVGTESTIRPDNAQPFSKAGIRDDNGRPALNRSASGSATGRWPANLIHDGSDEVVGLFPQSKDGVAVRHRSGGKNCHSVMPKPAMPDMTYGAGGSAARFFYCAKASKRDREFGLSPSAPVIPAADMVDREDGSDGMNSPRAGAGRTSGSRNNHPTVKPIALMRYLCRLVTPPNGLVLDPFCGSGSTGVAAVQEGFSFIGIDADPEWAALAEKRITGALEHGGGV